jgi:hypothetical protein
MAVPPYPRLGTGTEAGRIEAALVQEVLALEELERPPGPAPPA